MGAIGGAGLKKMDINASELGQVLAGQKSGRTSSEQITTYGPVGLAFQDFAASWHVYQKALEMGVGQSIDFNK